MTESKKLNRELDNLGALRADRLEARQYQVEIAKDCALENYLVVIPTGLGKTIIAVLDAAYTLEKYPKGSKIIVLAPTRPLINQHYDTFLRFLDFPEKEYCILTGKIDPKKRPEEFASHQFLFFTPQTLRNDLSEGRYTLKEVSLIVFDEAHHASGDYPYGLIADTYMDQNPDGNILALTASPGSSKARQQELCESLHIPPKNVHIRTRKDKDVKQYLKPMDILKIGVELTPLMEDIYEILHHTLEQRLQYLSQQGLVEKIGERLFEKVIRKDLIRLNQDLIRIINGDGDKTGAYSAISINAQALIVFHMLELLEQQGLDMLFEYLKKINHDAKKKNSSKAVKILTSDPNLRKIFMELKKTEGFSPKSLVHPKYAVLEQILKEEFRANPEARILIFIKFRISVAQTVKRLKQNPEIRPKRFVGQATKSKKDKGLSQKRQLEILDRFKQGKYNVLVSTNIGEEGLDIAECDIVIFYDVVASEIRLIQRKGRTARHREGKVVILYCKGTKDEKYLSIALGKLKRMNTQLKILDKMKDRDSQSLSSHARVGKSSEREDCQVCLSQFAAPGSSVQENGKIARKSRIPLVQLSLDLPMKYGIRTFLKQEKIPFEVSRSAIHISFSNRFGIHLFRAEGYSEANFQELHKFVSSSQHTYKLVFCIFDFCDYEEAFENEKQAKKQELQRLASQFGIKSIPIDLPEEFQFLLKSAYLQHKERTKEK